MVVSPLRIDAVGATDLALAGVEVLLLPRLGRSWPDAVGAGDAAVDDGRVTAGGRASAGSGLSDVIVYTRAEEVVATAIAVPVIRARRWCVHKSRTHVPIELRMAATPPPM
ncbi:hypothetical protein [Streptomyces longwoodensis]|uniref:hypothetical protein n=1 Tax=Streptomyces longwoodensis TaxID=68231 RepID=UPI00131D22E6|nr:hypothetical protein [Streptomyces longwoodensis]